MATVKTILLLIGIPGSGKTTWRNDFLRKNQGWIAVSRDDYRHMLFNSDKLEYREENFITDLVKNTVTKGVKNKFNVILDATNVNIKYLKSDVAYYEQFGNIDFKIFDISVDKAKERDKNREWVVGEEIIDRMYKDYCNLFNSNFDFSPRKKKPYIAQGITWKRNGNLPNAVIFDMDGTLAHMQGKRGTFDWNRVSVDSVDEKVAETLKTYKKAAYKVIVVTGRDGLCEDATKQWLHDNKIEFDYLFIKGVNDSRKDTITKTEIYEQHIKGKFNILCAYDDRDQSVKMWRDLGIKCYQVADGAF